MIMRYVYCLLSCQCDIPLSINGTIAGAVDFIVHKATRKVGKQNVKTTSGGTKIVFESFVKICSAAKQMKLSKVC